MNKLVTIAMAAAFVLSLQGPGRAQKEVAPPPIPPLLEGQRPLDHPETKETAAPRKPEEKKAKVKSSKNQKKAKVKKLGGKKRQTAVKKNKKKTSKKKRPAETQKEAGPDEG
ncbi:MAG: hypothetical protein A2Z73_04370 [Deltaproteobacteria bacterium RBG_13_60_28]|nr:MAG: hypothetical protein A2Z73_04370 [Deltaproteobacteria bacterium RBG_13_60_28]